MFDSSNFEEEVKYVKDFHNPPVRFKDLKPDSLIIADGLYKEITQTLGKNPYWVIAENAFIPGSTKYSDGMQEEDYWDMLEKLIYPIQKTDRKKICYRFAFKLVHKGDIVHGAQPLVLWNFHFDGTADYEQRPFSGIVQEQRDPLSETPLPKHAVDWDEYINDCSEIVHV